MGNDNYGYGFIGDEQMSSGAIDQILGEIEKTLFEMRALAMYAAQDDVAQWQRAKAQARIDELKKEIDGIAAMLLPPDLPMQ